MPAGGKLSDGEWWGRAGRGLSNSDKPRQRDGYVLCVCFGDLLISSKALDLDEEL